MSDPEVLDRILENFGFRFRNVVCPDRDKVASIAAARLHMDDADWSVIVLPSGEVKCGMTCLLREFEREK